jgi:hypothetical protein
MAKEKKSELQGAADRVREMAEAVKESIKEENKQVEICNDLMNKWAAAQRKLEDARSLLRAQKEKLQRELDTVIGIATNCGIE